MLIGDGDGELVVIRYIQVIVIGFYLVLVSSRLKSNGLSKLSLSFSSLITFIAFLELTFHIVVNLLIPKTPYASQIETNSSNSYFTQYDKDLGYKTTPLSNTTEKFYFKDKELVNVEYNFDKFGRRYGCDNKVDISNEKYACFIGCSFTLGSLVNAWETLPCSFAKHDTSFTSYNYGLNGYGTQHLLATLRSRDLRSEINEEEGILIYTFIDRHIGRVIGDKFIFDAHKWANELPYYDLNNDSLALRGNFGDDRPITNLFYKTLNKSYVLRYFGINFPLAFREHHFELAGRLIDASFKEYKKQFNSNYFYVLIFPGQSPKIANYISDEIRILDYSDLYDSKNPKYFIPGDFHPSPEAYDLVAKQLAKDIGDEYYII